MAFRACFVTSSVLRTRHGFFGLDHLGPVFRFGFALSDGWGLGVGKQAL